MNRVLNNSLPLLITNENCIHITEENHDGYSCNHDDVGKFFYKLPHQFAEGKTFPKNIVLDNISMFDEDGKELLGYSVHCGFNTESVDLDQCIGFITYLHKSTTWKMMRNNKYTLVWFKDRMGNPVEFKYSDEKQTRAISPRFVLNGYFKF